MGTYQIETEDGSVYEIETEDTVSTPSPIAPQGASTEELGFMDALGELSWGDVGRGFVNTAKAIVNIPSAVSNLGKSAAHFVSGTNAETGQDVDRGAMLQRGAENIQSFPMRMIPGGNALNERFKESLGYETPKSSYEYGQMVKEDIAALPAQAAAIVAPGMTKGTATGFRDVTIGKPQNVRLAEQSLSNEIFGNKLNAARGISRAEDAIVENAARYADEFAEANPVAGIDPSKGRVALEEFEKNLDDIKVSSIKKRDQEILPAVAKAEAAKIEAGAMSGQPVKVGVSFDDIPKTITKENGLTYGLENIKQSAPEGVAGVLMAQNYLKEQFGIMPSSLVDEFGNTVSQGQSRVLTTTELNNVRKAVDGQIREWGGWDDQMLASMKPGLSPSVRDGYVEALQFYRTQLDSAVKNHISSLVGPEVAEAFDKAGKNIAMSNQYGLLAGRFKRETGQAFTPGSAKQVPPGTGVLGTQGMTGKAVQAISPQVAKARMETQALQREGNAIAELQMLIDFKTGVRAMPAPRGWAQIKTSMQHLTNVGTLAVQMGLIGAVEDLVNMPDEAAIQIVGQVAANAPFAFEQNPDKVNVIDNKFVTPMDKDIVVKGALDLPPSERAKKIGASFENKYIPPVTPTPTPPIKETPLPIELSTINNALSIPDTQVDSSFDRSASSMIEELEKTTNLHAQYEYVQ